jgi:hypothetical protein
MGTEDSMMKSKLCNRIIWIVLVVGLAACTRSTDPAASFDLESLIIDVFDPQPGEKILVMIDVPKGIVSGNASAWYTRRGMAQRWHEILEQISVDYGFETLPMLRYPATGAHSGPLPVGGEMDGQPVVIEEVFAEANIVLALTEFSATAPLIEATQRYPQLRAASMPTISPGMEATALSADYGEVARKVQILTERLDRASGAVVEFSTGQQMYFDLRYRHAEADDGQLHADETDARVINLPSGEAYIVPYEGEQEGIPSNTAGTIPIMCGNDMALLEVAGNRVVNVVGVGDCARGIRDFLNVDDARRNIAEMGLGVNDRAVVSGNVLEDEKVQGMHWAFGLSEALGGTVGIDDFTDPDHALHWDIVYPTGGALEIADILLVYEDGSSEEIMRAGRYTVFSDGPQDLSLSAIVDTLSSAWFVLAVACVGIVAWDMEKLFDITWGTKFAWAWMVMVFGVFGLVVYFKRVRRSDERDTDTNRALGATLYGATGAVTGSLFVMLLSAAFTAVDNAGSLVTLALLLGLPFIVSLFLFRSPFIASQLRGRYGAALRKSILTETISILFVLAGIFPAMMLPLVLLSDVFGGVDQRTLVLFAFGAIIGAIVAYPLNLWMVRQRYAVWPGEEGSSGEVKLPTFQDARRVLLVGAFLFILSLGATLIIIAK